MAVNRSEKLTYGVVTRAPRPEIEMFKKRMGMTVLRRNSIRALVAKVLIE